MENLAYLGEKHRTRRRCHKSIIRFQTGLTSFAPPENSIFALDSHANRPVGLEIEGRKKMRLRPIEALLQEWGRVV